MPGIGGLHHIELQALDLERAMLEWGWLLPRLDHAEHQRWSEGASWMCGSTYVVVARAATSTPHDRRGAGLNHLAFRAGDRAMVDRIWREAEGFGWRRLTGGGYRWSAAGEAESAFLESSERVKVELCLSNAVQV